MRRCVYMRKCKIFIVEDEPDIIKLYRTVLKKKGYEVEIAMDGKEAVEKYMKFDEKPDLIIMDHRMPVKSGLEAAAEILSINKNARILFASADVSVREKALQMGAVGFLKKPFSLKLFLSEIESILDR